MSNEFDEGIYVIKRVSGPAKTETSPGRAKSREGMKLLLTPVEPPIHKRLKILAAQRDTTMEMIVKAALVEYLEKHEGQ